MKSACPYCRVKQLRSHVGDTPKLQVAWVTAIWQGYLNGHYPGGTIHIIPEVSIQVFHIALSVLSWPVSQIM